MWLYGEASASLEWQYPGSFGDVHILDGHASDGKVLIRCGNPVRHFDGIAGLEGKSEVMIDQVKGARGKRALCLAAQ
ncbi:hypothetical protein RRF57_010786 [Xylaria bambusicola]|uniref:Uncharacterized protein n=1 Tax=Xylaria bambusicola TaxID=326684 RepID=A0AAN7V3Y4_9PEZI